MRVWIAALVCLVGAATMAQAEEPNTCEVPSYLQHTDATLGRVAAAVRKSRKLDVMVVGSGSSQLPGADGPRFAYPARLNAALAARLPGVSVKVTTDVKPRRTCEQMAETFPRMIAEHKPTLVIWQTGTFDAIRGIDPDDFRAKLANGIDALHDGGADVVLLNPQFSPRTELMLAAGTYADNMRVVAQQHEVPLFDRMAIMKHWSEAGTFDLSTAASDPEMAHKVHDCIGRLLSDLVIDGSGLERHHSNAKP